jgi:hypothetical protein
MIQSGRCGYHPRMLSKPNRAELGHTKDVFFRLDECGPESQWGLGSAFEVLRDDPHRESPSL